MVEQGLRLRAPVWGSVGRERLMGGRGEVLSLAGVGGALGSPGLTGGPDVFHRRHQGQIGRI